MKGNVNTWTFTLYEETWFIRYGICVFCEIKTHTLKMKTDNVSSSHFWECRNSFIHYHKYFQNYETMYSKLIYVKDRNKEFNV